MDNQPKAVFIEAENKTLRILRELVRSSARYAVPLETTLALREKFTENLHYYFDVMEAQGSIRSENLARFKDLSFVSLGEDCLSRTFLTQWGYKPSAAAGEISMPFSLAVHRLDSIAPLIKNNFDGYLDKTSLYYDEKYRSIYHRRYPISFNHESTLDYVENDFAKLIHTYKSRIENFINHLRSTSKKIIFVLHLRRPAGQESQVANLLTTLESTVRTDFLLIQVNTWLPSQRTDSALSTTSSDRLRVIDVAYPTDDYVWHDPVHCFGVGGVAFERKLSDLLLRALDPQHEDQGIMLR